jgi:hypothetical protein
MLSVYRRLWDFSSSTRVEWRVQAGPLNRVFDLPVH